LAFLFGIAVGLALGFAFGVAAWFGLALGVGTAGAVGGDTWTRYHIAVVIAAIRRSGPLRFGASLDWAYQAGLLRMSGVAYQFRHRQLQDWLCAGSDSVGEKPSPPG
jgi:hypothetical protein